MPGGVNNDHRIAIDACGVYREVDEGAQFVLLSRLT